MTGPQGGLPLDLGAQDDGEATKVGVRRRKSTRSARAHDDDENRTPGAETRPERLKAAAPVPPVVPAGRVSSVNVRLSSAMLEAVEKAVEQSPIEFGSVSDFVRRAVESELRRRGLVKTFRD